MIVLIPDQQVLAGAPATVEVFVKNQDGEAVAAAGAVTVTISRADGTIVVTAQAATSDPINLGRYSFALTSAQTLALDVLTAVWSDTGGVRDTTLIEVVGGFYFTVAELRKQPGLNDAAKWPVADLVTARRRVTDRIESVTGVSWVPRYRRQDFDGGNRINLVLDRPVPRVLRAVTISGVTQSLSGLVLREWGEVQKSSVFGGGLFAASSTPANVTIAYEHGYDRPPDDLKRAALIATAYQVLGDPSGVNPRALSISGEFGEQRLSYAGAGHPFGLPEVDDIVMSHSHRVPGMA